MKLKPILIIFLTIVLTLYSTQAIITHNGDIYPTYNTVNGSGNSTTEIQNVVNESILNLSNSYGYNWSDVDNIPAGFADGIDNTGSGGKSTNDQWLYNDSTNIYQNETYIWTVIYNETETDTLLAAQDACSEITGCVPNAVTNATMNQSTNWSNIDNIPSDIADGDDTGGNTTTQIRNAVNTSLYYQLIVNFSNILNFPSYVLTSNLLAKVGNWTDEKADYYTATTVNANLTAQDECSEITNCVVGAITDGNTNWDNSYNFVTNDTMNQSTNWSNIDNIPAGFADGVDNTGSGGKTAATLWLYNDSSYIYYNETYTWENIYNETETDTLLAAQDQCSEITGCVEDAVTNATMNQSVNWSNIDNMPAGFADGIDNTGTGGKSTNDQWLYNDSTNIYQNETYIWEVIYNETEVDSLISSFISYDTNASTECSGDTTYLDGEGNCDDISSVYVIASDWTTIDNYPASCAANTYVTSIGDTLTCVNVVNNTYSVNETTQFGGEVSGTFNNIVLAHDALDDQYYDSESDLTGLLNDNYAAISVTDTNATTECAGDTTYLDGEGNCDDISGVYVQASDWTTIDSYPASCAANTYMVTIGDTVSCIHVVNNTYSLNQTTNFAGEVTGTFGAMVLDHDALDDQYYDSESDLTTLLDDNYLANNSRANFTTLESLHLTIVSVNITCLNTACTFYINATDECTYYTTGGRECTG